jgi:hypothetical protein
MPATPQKIVGRMARSGPTDREARLRVKRRRNVRDAIRGAGRA